MDFTSLKEIWEAKPGAVVLLLVGFVVFLFFVVDTFRHRKHRKKTRRL